jgi:hypothetical protein
VKLFPRHQISLVAKRGDFLRRKYGRCGYRRVRQLFVRQGLKVPTKQTKRGRLWLNDGSCIRLRPERSLVLRLRAGSHRGWATVPHADRHRACGCSGGFSLAKLKAPLARFTPIAAASGGRFVRISSIALYAEFSPGTTRLRVTGVTWVIKSIWRQFGRRIRLPPIFLGGKTASDRVQFFLGEGHVAPSGMSMKRGLVRARCRSLGDIPD